MARPAKASDVRYLHATYQPVARCNGWDGPGSDGEEAHHQCSWRFQINAFGVTTEVKKRAKQHARDYPGHEVQVIQETVSTYWVNVNDLSD
jgi:hypothetical protein